MLKNWTEEEHKSVKNHHKTQLEQRSIANTVAGNDGPQSQWTKTGKNPFYSNMMNKQAE